MQEENVLETADVDEARRALDANLREARISEMLSYSGFKEIATDMKKYKEYLQKTQAALETIDTTTKESFKNTWKNKVYEALELMDLVRITHGCVVMEEFTVPSAARGLIFNHKELAAFYHINSLFYDNKKDKMKKFVATNLIDNESDEYDNLLSFYASCVIFLKQTLKGTLQAIAEENLEAQGE